MTIQSSIFISRSVGNNGKNLVIDVRTVQTRLNELMGKSRKPLKIDGLCGRKTKEMIADFQKSVLKFRWPDSRVDTDRKTIKAMNKGISATIWRSVPPAPRIRGAKKTINLHFRSISLTSVSFNAQYQAVVKVFGQYNINVVMKSGKSVWLSKADRKKFDRVDTSCVIANDEWSALQKLLNDVPFKDICVFFVGKLWDTNENPGSEMFLGCGAHRRGYPACVVAANANKYDMAHEVGHVLGLFHNDTIGNLMHSTQANYPKLPNLTPNELQKVRKSPLCR